MLNEYFFKKLNEIYEPTPADKILITALGFISQKGLDAALRSIMDFCVGTLIYRHPDLRRGGSSFSEEELSAIKSMGDCVFDMFHKLFRQMDVVDTLSGKKIVNHCNQEEVEAGCGMDMIIWQALGIKNNVPDIMIEIFSNHLKDKHNINAENIFDLWEAD